MKKLLQFYYYNYIGWHGSRQIEMESKTRKAAEEDLEGDQIFRSLLTDLLPDLQMNIEGGHILTALVALV